MLQSGAPLAYRLPGRIGLELRISVRGELRVLAKPDEVRVYVFRHRPAIKTLDWPALLFRALKMR